MQNVLQIDWVRRWLILLQWATLCASEMGLCNWMSNGARDTRVVPMSLSRFRDQNYTTLSYKPIVIPLLFIHRTKDKPPTVPRLMHVSWNSPVARLHLVRHGIGDDRRKRNGKRPAIVASCGAAWNRWNRWNTGEDHEGVV